ncbi:hypothetical protein SAMN05421538_105152 [Paracoccus isoporae]|uniref:DUF616 domain-containing protein n=1 Tax=Paracoccus isoporae TaxID=591205 RepID=A0A1G7BN40_9RHOB|nr:hypothetical protein [Paracoccus isoporae]SDE28581.1 hypothetical protein SAMN05421538_105152 [Paracoccus isoporae]
MTSRDNGVVLYSCYFGHHEPLNIDCLGVSTAAHKILFTDREDLRELGLPDDVECLRLPGDDAKTASRLPKICPHLVLPETARWALYVDNRAILKVSPEIVIQDLELQFGNCPSGRYLFRHHSRRDAYRELKTILNKGYIDQSQYDQTRALFQRSGLPTGGNLYVNTMMVQKMGDDRTDRLNETWLELFSTTCPRDQPILPYVMFKAGYPERIISADISDYIDWPVFKFKDRRRYRREVEQSKALRQKAS